MHEEPQKKYVTWEIFKWVIGTLFVIVSVIFTFQAVINNRVEAISAEEQAHVSTDAKYQEKVDHIEKSIDAIAKKLNVLPE